MVQSPDDPSSPDSRPSAKLVPIVWVGLEEEPVYAANQVLSQFQGDLFLLSFGLLTPPAVLGSDKEKATQIERLNFVQVRPVARVALTRLNMEQLITVLQENLQSYDRSRAGANAG